MFGRVPNVPIWEHMKMICAEKCISITLSSLADLISVQNITSFRLFIFMRNI